MKKYFSVQGIPVHQLAEQYGTPFFVYDGERLVENYTQLRGLLSSELEIFYSLKANPNISIYSLLHRHGVMAETSSLAELSTVLSAGTSPKDILFLGPGKDPKSLETLVDTGIYAIVCESIAEMGLVNSIAVAKGKKVDVALRINPNFAAKGSRLTMGGKPRQFGIDENTVFANPKIFKELTHVRILGIHVYMGTRILDANEIAENTKHIFELATRFKDAYDLPLQMVDIGGGLGVPYYDNETKLDVVKLGSLMNPLIGEFRSKNPKTRLIMELGRYLAAESGTFVSRALYVKESMGEQFVVTDGGTNCHMAAVGVGSFLKRNFPMANLSDWEGEATHQYHVTGPLCTPNDVVAKSAQLPPVNPGDLIGVLRSGAYGPTASPVLFLSFGYPAEVLVYEGKNHLIRERDTVQDILQKQRLFSTEGDTK